MVKDKTSDLVRKMIDRMIEHAVYLTSDGPFVGNEKLNSLETSIYELKVFFNSLQDFMTDSQYKDFESTIDELENIYEESLDNNRERWT